MAQHLTYERGSGGRGGPDFHARLLDAVEQAVIATDLEGRIIYWNRYASELYGWTAEEVVGRSVLELVPSPTSIEEARELMKELAKGDTWHGEFEVQRKDGSTFTAYVADSAVFDGDEQIGVVGVSMDVTERKREEEQREHLLQSLEREHRLVRELSTPILRVGERVLLLPLMGLLDDRRANFITDALLKGIRDERARTVVLDLTGVGEMYRQAADWLIGLVYAARLLGSEVILTGVSTEVAQTLVSLGTDLSRLSVAGDLQSGLEIALGMGGGPRGSEEES